MTVAPRELARQLNALCFQQIWNEIRAEYRVNIHLTLVRPRFASGALMVGQSPLALPAPGVQYAVYRLGDAAADGGLPLTPGVWTRADHLLHATRTLSWVYPPSGGVLPRDAVYLYRLARARQVLVAVEKPALLTVAGVGALAQPLYLTLYRDPDQANPITSWCYRLPTSNAGTATTGALNRLASCRAVNAAGTILTVNGLERAHATPPVLNPGDHVEIVLDENVVGEFEVNLTAAPTGYHSLRYGQHRTIIHPPKALNPAARVITHNTCTLFVRNAAGVGRYLHRTDPEALGQITHCDFSVDSAVIDALRDHHGSEDVRVHVRVRTHGKDNALLTERSYIRYLYRCDDAVIVRHLRGELDADLSFWRADQLEQSGYLRLLFDTPNTASDALLGQYVADLGYYTVASLLADPLRHFVITKKPFGHFLVPKPFVLRDRLCTALVYLDGRKLRATQVRVSDGGEHLRVAFAAGVYYTTGQRVTVRVVEATAPAARYHTPSLSQPSLVVPWDAVAVWEEIPLATPVSGVGRTAAHSYKPRAELTGTLMVEPHADGLEVVFGPSLYGTSFVLVNPDVTLAVEQAMDAVIDSGAAFVQPLTMTVDTGTETRVLPFLSAGLIEAYVNGRKLIDGLDVTAVPLTAEGGVALTELVVANMSAFGNGPGNQLEVVVVPERAVRQETGYLTRPEISYDQRLNLWYEGLSQAYVGGALLHDVVNHGTWLETSGAHDTGTPYEIVTRLPARLARALAGYDDQVDVNRLEVINRNFHRTVPPAPTVVLYQTQWRLYSPWLTTIIQDIVALRFVPVDDPDDQRFLAQFQGYAYWKARDPAFTDTQGRVDRACVNLYPLYREQTIDNPLHHRIIQRLVRLTLAVDFDTVGDEYL